MTEQKIQYKTPYYSLPLPRSMPEAALFLTPLKRRIILRSVTEALFSLQYRDGDTLFRSDSVPDEENLIFVCEIVPLKGFRVTI